jgi:predicted nucleic acid-binding protein
MKSVFIDTGGFYAALNRKDVAHRVARRLFNQAREERWTLFTTNFVVAETQALILIRRGRHRAWQFLQTIYAGSTNIVRVEEQDERRARSLIEQYHDKDFSYCDAISFVVMERLSISKVISFDEHFRQYGKFVIL